MSDVFMNGKYIGTVENPEEFVSSFRTERRTNTLSDNVNVYHDKTKNEVYIFNNGGRVRRPLIIVKDGRSLLTEQHLKQLEKGDLAWSDLLKQGIIEFLDSSEEENAFIAFTDEEITDEHTHLEISPLVMFSLCTSLFPFANFTQGTRVSIGSKNQKQALGLYASNFFLRLDMDISLLHNPERPLVQSVMHGVSDYDAHPSGANVVVAIMAYDGYNMDDALVINRASIDRGLGRSTYYRPMSAEELRYSGGLTDEVSIPDKDVKGYKSEDDYKLLEEDGIIIPEASVKEGDVVIGRTSPPRFLSGLDEYNLVSSTRRESSVSLRHGEQGIVDFVMLTENINGNKIVQVRLREQRIPEVGDKFTSRHGQKGVVGLIVEPGDMPFTSQGITPDLIFSPHGIPSRMTVSHVLELLGGKVASMNGRYVDGTTFESEHEYDLRSELRSLGFREDGTEKVYNGTTGKKLKVNVFVGDMYYLKLRHMVANKLHARARGPIQLLTRQPTEGRAKEGGLRLGEMEKDTFVAHGASLLLKERFDSDRTVVPICETCGMIALYDGYKDRTFCPVCANDAEISSIELSYAFKLLLDELRTFGLYPKLKLVNKY
ncbi:DNA-directed RNA polymerase subunit B [Candidatus Woesearchaeota archaeon]|nr:DNA-directed RNA polymerase subunit B [Candidatus Woesearchaeota archaeon]